MAYLIQQYYSGENGGRLLEMVGTCSLLLRNFTRRVASDAPRRSHAAFLQPHVSHPPPSPPLSPQQRQSTSTTDCSAPATSFFGALRTWAVVPWGPCQHVDNSSRGGVVRRFCLCKSSRDALLDTPPPQLPFYGHPDGQRQRDVLADTFNDMRPLGSVPPVDDLVHILNACAASMFNDVMGSEYECDGTSPGWQSEESVSLADGHAIAIVALGAPCELQLRDATRGEQAAASTSEAYRMYDGDLLLLSYADNLRYKYRAAMRGDWQLPAVSSEAIGGGGVHISLVIRSICMFLPREQMLAGTYGAGGQDSAARARKRRRREEPDEPKLLPPVDAHKKHRMTRDDDADKPHQQ